MRKILVSACLLGERVRYDGGDSGQRSEIIDRWRQEERLISLCPEVAGGLPIPRLPAEIQENGRIINIEAEDVTAAFEQGAQKALDVCREHQISVAILKEGSPSCGSSKINSGNFDHVKVPGQGVTTRLLEANGIRVFSEDELEQAAAYLQSLDS